jgi:uncharacterized protein YaiE (UPF0345 family)
MNKFENISIEKQANIYFEGQVTSRKITFPDGSYKTLGIMLPGEYEFNTEKEELMEISSGKMVILIKGDEKWQTITGGKSFRVPAKSSFKLQVESVVDYCCSYF